MVAAGAAYVAVGAPYEVNVGEVYADVVVGTVVAYAVVGAAYVVAGAAYAVVGGAYEVVTGGAYDVIGWDTICTGEDVIGWVTTGGGV